MSTHEIIGDRSQRPATAAAARDHVRHLLETGLGEQDSLAEASVVVADALLVTSELVTNAIRHGGGVAAFTASLSDDTLRISVADHSPEPPHTRSPADGVQPGGYGWPLVQRLCAAVLVAPCPGGKTIHAELRLT
jgi:anti-sigma regulatory factor (Ser/Thr protein kinase)